MTTMFEHFFLNGKEYYNSKGKYYIDNSTIRQEITLGEYKEALMNYLTR